MNGHFLPGKPQQDCEALSIGQSSGLIYRGCGGVAASRKTEPEPGQGNPSEEERVTASIKWAQRKNVEGFLCFQLLQLLVGNILWKKGPCNNVCQKSPSWSCCNSQLQGLAGYLYLPVSPRTPGSGPGQSRCRYLMNYTKSPVQWRWASVLAAAEPSQVLVSPLLSGLV